MIQKKTSNKLKKKTELRDFSQQANYTTERPPLAGEVTAYFCG
jgi:hypothetical protein